MFDIVFDKYLCKCLWQKKEKSPKQPSEIQMASPDIKIIWNQT